MNNTEYLENQEKQKRESKKLRKSMRRALILLLLAGASVFVFPEYIFPTLNKLLAVIFGVDIANFSVVALEGLGLFGGGILGLYNLYKANKAGNELDRLQDKEERLVIESNNKKDDLTRENEKLKTTVKSLEKDNKLLRNALYKRNGNVVTEEKELEDVEVELESDDAKRYKK